LIRVPLAAASKSRLHSHRSSISPLVEAGEPVAEAVEAGHASVKMFTTDITPSRRGRMVDFGDIWEVLKVLAQAGGIAAIHAEDNDIVMHMYEKLTREDHTGFENMAEVHNTLSEDLSFNRVIRLPPISRVRHST
jgi:dihydropyrimidinase